MTSSKLDDIDLAQIESHEQQEQYQSPGLSLTTSGEIKIAQRVYVHKFFSCRESTKDLERHPLFVLRFLSTREASNCVCSRKTSRQFRQRVRLTSV